MTGILILNGSLGCLKELKTTDMILGNVNFQIVFSLFSVTYIVGTHQCVPTRYVHSINERFHHNQDFSQTSQILFMFQCNEHVEMNKFLCSLACTWMAIIDSQFHIIDSLSLHVSLD